MPERKREREREKEREREREGKNCAKKEKPLGKKRKFKFIH